MKNQKRAMPPLEFSVIFHSAVCLKMKSSQHGKHRGAVEPSTWNNLCHMMLELADDNLACLVRSLSILHTLFPNESRQERINIVPCNC